MLWKLIRSRLAFRADEDLSPKQFGFRTERSTVDAIVKVIRIVLLITLDVRNAFKFVRWTDMRGPLENSFHVPSCLSRILRDYLKDRSLLYDTIEGLRRMEITLGVTKGSILVRDLWNASYDTLLRLDMPEESCPVAYADDVVALVTGSTVEQAQTKLGILMRWVSG